MARKSQNAVIVVYGTLCISSHQAAGSKSSKTSLKILDSNLFCPILLVILVRPKLKFQVLLW